MLETPGEDDIEFLIYLISHLPVSYLFMTYDDFKRSKQPTPITQSDINALELKLKLGAYKIKNNNKS